MQCIVKFANIIVYILNHVLFCNYIFRKYKVERCFGCSFYCVNFGSEPPSVLNINVEADEPTEDLEGGAEHKPPVNARITYYTLLYIHLQKLVFSLFIFGPYDCREIQECIRKTCSTLIIIINNHYFFSK